MDVIDKDEFDVDHIFHNTNDNRKEKLRLCTTSQNTMNKEKQSNNTSGVIGISLNNKLDKWEVSIKVNYKKIHLGYFSDFDEALDVRRQAEEKYFGEYRFRKEIMNEKNIGRIK